MLRGKKWRDLEGIDCPDCGNSLEVLTSATEGWFDSDVVRCVGCGYRDAVFVDEDGNTILQHCWGDGSMSGEAVKTIDKCPVCGSDKLEQEYQSIVERGPMIVGGEHTSLPPILGGTTCANCGTKNKFNKKGPCPACKGEGEFTYITYRGGMEESSYKLECSVCKGKGVI